MTNLGPRSRSGQTIQAGDTVAVMLHTYRNGEVTGSKVAARGLVRRIYRHGERGQWRASIQWEDDTKAFLYTGKTNWAYVREIELVKRANAKR